MKSHIANILIIPCRLFLFLIATLGVIESSRSQETLYNFPGTAGGDISLMQGFDGNFYGTTYSGGSNNLGFVFKMTPNGVVTNLVSFNGTNGANPNVRLLQASDGNFYGTTSAGGKNNLGTVFKMTPDGGLTALVTFNASNGGVPDAALVEGNDGNFYGTTFWGGNLSLNGGSGFGTIFKMTTAGVLTTLAQFNGINGANPGADIVQGSDGNFYGTTYSGGNANLGTVFKITPDGTLTRLVSFFASNGGHPRAGLIQAGDGNFYGTTFWGGDLSLNSGNGYGTIFKMTPDGTLTTLVQFNGNNGGHPNAGLVQGSDGNFYGTTAGGNDAALVGGNGYGTVFKMTPDGVLTTLISFTVDNGAYPYGGIMQAGDGDFYGTTSGGGAEGGGTVFRFDASSPLGFTQQPGDRSVSIGANVLFQSVALGTTPLAYQWYFNGTNISNATNSSLIIADVQSTNAGSYTVVVTNFSGSVTSRVAMLQVDSAFTKITSGPMVAEIGTGSCPAWGDYDNDGFIDLALTSGFNSLNRTPQKNILYHNNQDGTFTKVTNAITSIAQDWRGCSWADYDNDGYLDLFAVGYENDGFPGSDYLFHNNGDGSFSAVTVANTPGGFSPGEGSEGPVWADYNRDGFVDLYIAKYGMDWFYRNNGNSTFTRLTNEAVGLVADNQDSYNAMWSDYDNDGWPDLFVGVKDDSGQNQANFLYHNEGNGKFSRVLSGRIVTDNDYSIACVWGDYDNDGYPDLFVTSGVTKNGTNVLYHNNGDGTFTRMSSMAVGSLVSDVSWFTQAAWGDYDNDGYLDLFVSTDTGSGGGEVPNPIHSNFLYHNNGDGTFTRVMTGSLVNDVGLSYGCAWGDYDNDGFLDLFVARGSDAAPATNLLYRNNGNSNGWLKVKLIGTVSNRSAIGAKVRVHAAISGKTFWQLREINTGDGYCAGPLEADFGLGDAAIVDTLRIEWPSGTVQEFHDVSPKQILTITEPPRLMVSVTNGVPQFSFKGGRNLQYEIQSSTNLITWSLIDIVTVTNLDGTARITDTNAPTTSRFYRVRSLSGGRTGDDADLDAARSGATPFTARIKAAQDFAAYVFFLYPASPLPPDLDEFVGEVLSIAYELDRNDPVTLADMNHYIYLRGLAGP